MALSTTTPSRLHCRCCTTTLLQIICFREKSNFLQTRATTDGCFFFLASVLVCEFHSEHRNRPIILLCCRVAQNRRAKLAQIENPRNSLNKCWLCVPPPPHWHYRINSWQLERACFVCFATVCKWRVQIKTTKQKSLNSYLRKNLITKTSF